MRGTVLGITAFVGISTGAFSRDASAAHADAICTGVQVTPGKTKVLHHPKLNLIFWGPEWGNQGAQVAGLIATVQDMISGAYFSPLNQYFGIRNPVLGAQVAWYTGTDPINGFYETLPKGAAPGTPYVVGAMAGAMKNGSVPPDTTANTDDIWVVFAPPGATSLDHKSFPGRHGTGPGVNGNYVPFAWVTNGTNGVPYTQTFSHEVVEAMTDFAAGETGIYTNCGGSENEIADICNLTEYQRGYSVSSYWSATDSQCIIPETYSNIYQYNNGFQAIGQQTVKVFPGYLNGSPVLVATDPSDNAWVAPSLGTIGPIAPAGGAMYAVANDSIYALAIDGLGVFRWNGLGQSWQNLGLPPNQIVTGIYGGAYPVATDTFGEVWTWSVATNSWKLVAGTSNEVSQVTENGSSLYLLSHDHSNAWQYQGSGLTSLNFNGFSELVTGGGNNTMLAAVYYDNTLNSLGVESGGSLNHPGTPAFTEPSGFSQVDTYVISADTLVAFSGDHQSVAVANNPTVAGAGWTNLPTGGVPLSRVYGQTSTLIATGKADN